MALRDTFGDGSALLDQLMAVVRRDGLMDLVGGLNQVGADEQTTSWMGSGPNEPVSPDQVADALGRTRVESIASALGAAPDDVAAGIARILPAVVDRLTPSGTYPNHATLEAADMSDLDLPSLLG